MTDDVLAFDRLGTRELRERAVALARSRWDVRFLWHLLQSLPAAEAVAGNMGACDATVAQASGLFHEALAAEDDPRVQEALRPLYIDYLSQHEDESPPAGTSGTDAP